MTQELKQDTATKDGATEKRRAIVTGASSGLGETFARQLAKKDYDVVLVARRKDRLDKLAAELSEGRGTECEVIEADLTTPEGVAQVEERLRRGDIQMLVNNAGFGTQGEFADLPIDREMQEIDLNIRTLARLSHVALETMREKKRGAIINVGSTGSFQPVPYMATYAATKAFVLHFSEALHEEAKKYGVTVTCLCPGPVKTGFQEAAGLNADRMRVGWTTCDQVVKSALKASAGGSAITIPGMMNKVTAASTRFTPRFLVRKVAGSMFKDAGA